MGKKGGSGAKFEAEIAQLFRSAGYSVEMNVELGGQEFDIIAKRRQFGEFFVCFAVECKYRSKGTTSNQEVHDFVNAYRACADAHGLTFGFLVSNQGFSRQAHEAVSAHAKISLMTSSMLEDELLGARTYLENSKNYYRTDFTNYISLRGTTVSINEKEPVSIPDVAGHCVGRMAQGRRSFTFLLGDFGSGKTTLAEQTHARLVDVYLAGESDVFPLILYLRTLEQYDTEQEFIEAHLKLGSQDFGLSSLEAVSARKRLALILDGFDEVAANASEEERMRLFSRAMRIAARGQSVLLTSRPAYFDNYGELVGLIEGLIARDHAAVHRIDGQVLRRDSLAQTILDKQQAIALSKLSPRSFPQFSSDATEMLVVNPLDKSDIIRFLSPYKNILKMHYGKSPEQIYNFLTGIYDLTDLLTRPLLIDMFLDLLKARAVDLSSPDMQIGPAGLYSLYINYHLTRDWEKRRFLTPGERLAFARSAAIAMLESGGSLEATYESVLRLVTTDTTVLSDDRRHLLETDRTGVVTDVRVCSFMNVTQAGRIEFSHKSFMEYFVADVIAARLGKLEKIDLLDRELNYEILYFLGSFALLRSELRLEMLQHLQHVAYDLPVAYRTNLIVALMFSEQVSRDREFADYEFSRIRIARKGFNNCEFHSVIWHKAALFHVDFDGCELDDLRIDGEVIGLSLRACSGSLTLPAICEGISIESSSNLRLLSNSSAQLKLTSGEWQSSRISVHANMILRNMQLRDVMLAIAPGSQLQIENSKLRETIVHTTELPAEAKSLPHLSLNGAGLQGCTVVFVRMSRDDYIGKDHALRGVKGIVVIDDPERAMMAFRRDDPDKVSRYHGWDKTGSLLVVSAQIYAHLTRSERREIEATVGGYRDFLESHMRWDVAKAEAVVRTASSRMLTPSGDTAGEPGPTVERSTDP